MSGLVLTPVIVRGLGTDGYALRSLALAAMAYVGILDVGIGTAVVTRVANAMPSAKEVERITRTATATYLPLCAISAIVGAVASWYAPTLFNIRGHSGEVRATFAIVALWQLINILLAVPSGALQGGGRFGTVTIRGTVIGLIAAIAQAVIAATTHNVVGVAIAIAGSSVTTFVVCDRLARRLIDGYRLSPFGADLSVSRNLLRLGSSNAVVFIAGSAGYGSDVLIVGLITGARTAAFYAIASRASQFATTFALQIATTLSGSYATLSAQAQLQRAWALCVRATGFSLLVLVPMAISLIGFGRGLLVLWVGQIGSHGYAVLVILVLVGCVQLCGHNAFILITGLERTSLLTRISVASATANVGISIALTYWVGITGPAYGSLVTATLIELVVLPQLAAKLCGARVASLIPSYLRLLPPTAGGVAVCMGFRSMVGSTGWSAVAGAALSSAAFVVVCAMIPALRKEVRDVVAAMRTGSSEG